MALSAIGALRDLFQDSEINIIAPDFVAGLFKRHPSVDSVLSLKDGTHHGFKSISATRNLLRDSGDDFEIGILLTDSLSAATAFKFSGVTHIYGYSGSGKALALSGSLTPSSAIIHRSKRYQNLVRFAALSFWENPYWVKDVKYEDPEFYFSDVERAAAKAILERAGVIENSNDTASESGA
ncbi:hypothetical protein JYU19_02305, partial [bacterium AH-315-J21]|nr:hypothetical protein [bacterium AH-315-J21]